jgi:hypothetical protein
LKEHTGCLQIWYRPESDLIPGVNDDLFCTYLFQGENYFPSPERGGPGRGRKIGL